jgi:hypothetical protein
MVIKNRFFDKTDGPGPEVAYRKFKLLCISADGPVIAELGGESKVEGTFGAAFAFHSLFATRWSQSSHLISSPPRAFFLGFT